MVTTIRIKRRALGGAAGAPSSLGVGELAFNEVDGGLYIGRSDGSVVQVNPTGGGGFTTGDAKLTLKTTADTGWVLMDDGNIGDASSNGTTRANADCQALFTLLWNNISDSWCGVYDSLGNKVTRGASAAADWAAHRRIYLPRELGRALIVGGTGAGLSARTMGSYLGEESHVQTLGELVNHQHTSNAAVYSGSQIFSDSVDSWIVAVNPGAATINYTGSSTAANVMQPSAVWNIMIKL